MEGKVCILGGGPSAVYAYFGALDAGYKRDQIEIWVDRFNIPPGAFWLRESPIPWPDIEVHYNLIGTLEGYSQKQWGDTRKTSADKYFANSHSWRERNYNPRLLLPTIWPSLPVKRIQESLSEEGVEHLKTRVEAVIQTFTFDRTGMIRFPVWTGAVQNDSFICTYNGDPAVPWLRQSLVPGSVFVEYPSTETDFTKLIDAEDERWSCNGNLVFAPDWDPTVKPLTWPERIRDNLLLVGRFGAKDRKSLSHHARQEVKQFLLLREEQ